MVESVPVSTPEAMPIYRRAGEQFPSWPYPCVMPSTQAAATYCPSMASRRSRHVMGWPSKSETRRVTGPPDRITDKR